MRSALLPLLALLLGAAGPPESWIDLYCGGGVTGGGGGLRALEDGTLIRTRRPRAGAPVVEERVDGPPAPLARWNRMLDEARFEAMPRGTPSNMTCGLTRGRGGATHVVLWGIGREPPALREVLREMREAARP